MLLEVANPIEVNERLENKIEKKACNKGLLRRDM